MKARTKHQKLVVKTDKKIKPIGVRMKRWAEREILKKICFRNKWGRMHCMECGHKWRSESTQAWHDEITETKCPSCKEKLELESNNKRSYVDSNYFTYVDKKDDFQVIRTFMVSGTYKIKKQAEFSVMEVYRIYIHPIGKMEVVARLRNHSFYYYSDSWSWDMELRHPTSIHKHYNLERRLYHKWKLHDYIIEKGFNAYSYEESGAFTHTMMHMLLNSPHAETLLKDGRTELFDFTFNRGETVDKYWPTIRICIRNSYIIDDPNSYFDMINALEYLEKDLRNPKYVCPKDFKKEHDRWINKRYQVRRKLAIKEEFEKRKEDAKIYSQHVQKFKDIMFVGDGVEIVPLKTLGEVYQAGEQLHHCIYKTERYWKSHDKLLFGAFVNGKLVETASFCLEKFHVTSCYGVNNKRTKYNNIILRLLNNNRRKIEMCLKPKKKRITKLKKKQLQVA